MAEDCIFCNIVAGGIPAEVLYEDDHVMAFKDINPQAPVHALIIPRRHLPAVSDMTRADTELIGQLHWAASQLARDLGIAESGFRLVINNGADAQQTVAHLHLHLLGGRSFAWPPG